MKMFYIGAEMDPDDDECNGGWRHDFFVSAPTAQDALALYTAYYVLNDLDTDHMSEIVVLEIPAIAAEPGLHHWYNNPPGGWPTDFVKSCSVATPTNPLPKE